MAQNIKTKLCEGQFYHKIKSFILCIILIEINILRATMVIFKAFNLDFFFSIRGIERKKVEEQKECISVLKLKASSE